MKAGCENTESRHVAKRPMALQSKTGDHDDMSHSIATAMLATMPPLLDSSVVGTGSECCRQAGDEIGSARQMQAA
jgi:hypothetical protein